MKAIMILTRGTGGHPRYVSEVLSALATYQGEGFQVELVATADLDNQFRNRDYAIHAVLPAEPQRSRHGFLVWRIRQIWHLIQTERVCLKWLQNHPEVDVIHFQNTFWLTVPFWFLYRRLGKPLFHTIHNIRPHRYSGVMPRSIEDTLSRWMWRHCDALFVHSNSLRETAIRFLGHSHPPVIIAPHGLFKTKEYSANVSLGARLKKKKILFFGTIRRDKGLHVLLTAMQGLQDYQLTIAGKPEERNYWQTEILPEVNRLCEAGYRINVIDKFIPDECLGELFIEHSFLALPYTPDFHAQSGVLYLAMALGTPVVASDVGGLAEFVSHRMIGEVASTSSAVDFTHAIARLYQRIPVDLEANIKAVSNLSLWQEHATALIHTYRNIAKQFPLTHNSTTNMSY